MERLKNILYSLREAIMKLKGPELAHLNRKQDKESKLLQAEGSSWNFPHS